MGIPCVVTDAGDSAVLVGDTGVVVPKEDAEALAQGMARLAALGPDARRQLGGRARARIRSEFTMEQARKRFEAIYRELMQGTAEGRQKCAD
jgi:glycosyltransferase involved in cell wall biosynthesis